MTNKIKPIGICGNATVGKNALASILEKIFSESGIQTREFALAAYLKSDLNEFTTKNYGISAYTIIPEEKTLIRDLMVAHGYIKRTQSKGRYWTSLLLPAINEAINDGVLPIITDIRFDEYQEDEVWWIKNFLGGNLIFVSRFDKNGIPIPPANLPESRNELKLKTAANYSLYWPTLADISAREEIVRKQLNQLINEYCQK